MVWWVLFLCFLKKFREPRKTQRLVTTFPYTLQKFKRVAGSAGWQKKSGEPKTFKILKSYHQTMCFIDVLRCVCFHRLDRVMEWATAQSSDKWNSIRFHMSLDCTGSDSVALWKRRKWKIAETLENKWSGDELFVPFWWNLGESMEYIVWWSLFRTFWKSSKIQRGSPNVVISWVFWKVLKKW